MKTVRSILICVLLLAPALRAWAQPPQHVTILLRSAPESAETLQTLLALSRRFPGARAEPAFPFPTAFLRAMTEQANGQSTGPLRAPDMTRFVHLELPAGVDPEAAARFARALPGVESAEVQSLAVPADASA